MIIPSPLLEFLECVQFYHMAMDVGLSPTGREPTMFEELNAAIGEDCRPFLASGLGQLLPECAALAHLMLECVQLNSPAPAFDEMRRKALLESKTIFPTLKL